MPIVNASRLREGVYSIGGRLFPQSIRDQMVRASMFIERAVQQKRLVPSQSLDHPLLIEGAGLAGVVCAMNAARRGVHTVIFDRLREPILLQKSCDSRVVCPTQYDWPMPHYGLNCFPHPPAAPVWAADTAHAIANRVDAEFLAFRMTPPAPGRGRVLFLKGTELAKPRYAMVTGTQLVLPKWRTAAGRSSPEQLIRRAGMGTTFQMLLSAVGFGMERTGIPNAPEVRGFRFWEKDPYGAPNLGLPEGTSARVLIAGGGDGAIQDFLRLLFIGPTDGFTARWLLDELKLAPAVTADILPKVEEFNRTYAWSDPSNDSRFLLPCHAGMKALAERAWNSDPGMANRIRGMIRDDAPERIDWVVPKDCFNRSYPLNHFLGLLLLHFLEVEVERKPPLKCHMHWNRNLLDLKPVNPLAYAGNPVGMARSFAGHGQDHQVFLGLKRGDKPQDKPDFTSNVLIIRLGIEEPVAADEREAARLQQRQLLPYNYVPA